MKAINKEKQLLAERLVLMSKLERATSTKVDLGHIEAIGATLSKQMLPFGDSYSLSGSINIAVEAAQRNTSYVSKEDKRKADLVTLPKTYRAFRALNVHEKMAVKEKLGSESSFMSYLSKIQRAEREAERDQGE